MAEYTKQDIYDIITEYLEQYGSAVGSYTVHELTGDELTDAALRVLTIPGMRPDTQQWVQTSLRNMLNPIDNAISDLTTLKRETTEAKDAANTAATGAANVNAGLQGFTVTITDRNGQSRSVDIGFEIYRTYTSVAAMNADAANVPQGKFVIIATTDTTSTDNAKMYCKNSQGSFTFLCDLDQASSSAWADWLDNMKPQIEAATAAANAAAGRVDTVIATANSDHTRAESDHTRAESDHSTVVTATNNANIQANRAKLWADHPPYIADGTQQHLGDLNYWYIWSESLNQYVKSPYAKGDDLHWEEMSEQEKDDLAQRVLDVLTFASVETCEDIIDELT